MLLCLFELARELGGFAGFQLVFNVGETAGLDSNGCLGFFVNRDESVIGGLAVLNGAPAIAERLEESALGRNACGQTDTAGSPVGIDRRQGDCLGIKVAVVHGFVDFRLCSKKSVSDELIITTSNQRRQQTHVNVVILRFSFSPPFELLDDDPSDDDEDELDELDVDDVELFSRLSFCTSPYKRLRSS